MPKFKMPPSMNGDNMFSFKCESTNRICSYSICQHTVYAYKEKRLTGFDDCRQVIDKRECKAIKMMIEEKKAGKALYFDSYKKAREARADIIARNKALHAPLPSRKGPSIIASSRASSNEERIQRKELAKVPARPARTAKVEKPAAEQDSGNMFADVVNALSKGEV